MTEYRVKWTKAPTAYNEPRVLYVHANSESDAQAIARDHIERNLGIGDYIKFEVTPAPDVPPGAVSDKP